MAAICAGHKGYEHLLRAVTLHGLEVVFPNRVYQRFILPRFNRFDLIIAVSQAPKDKIVRTTTGLEVDNRGLVEVDENGATTREGVFSGGDVVLGPANVVEVVKDAKHVAKAMDAYLTRKRENGEKNAYPRETAE